jgi:hypothetical protein
MRTGGVREAVAVVLVASLVLAGSGAGAAQGASVVPQTGDVDPDGVVLRVDVAPNGTAVWTVEYRVRLDDENATAAFDSLQADVRENRTGFRERFAARMTRTVDAATNETGREMTLRNVTVTAERRQLPQEYGVVSYRFEWADFARVDGERLVVGDAVGGIFLDAESRLVLAWPADYEATTVEPGGFEDRDSAVSWAGPVDFGPNEPRAVVQPAAAGGDGVPIALVAGAVLVVGVVAAGGYVYRRRERGADGTGAVDVPEDDGVAGGAAAAPDDGPDEPPEDLLSPEERVLRYVRESGGRVKQQAVVSEFDWTAARTSQVVGSLREDGRVETFRLGRENVVTLPDVGVEGEVAEADEGESGDADDG